MASVATVSIDIAAESAKLRAELDKVKRDVRGLSTTAKSLQRSFNTVGKALVGAFSIGTVVKFTEAIFKATAEQEDANAQLAAALKSTGGVVGYTSEQLQGFASELQRTTTYADETIEGVQGILLTFDKIRGPIFKGATVAVLDVATRMKTDLRSAAIQLGKALNDPMRGLDGLNRAGIQFSDDQKATIQRLVQMGDTATAQKLILKELEHQFGGSAEAARGTFGGALAALKNSFGDLLEAPGGAPGLTTALNGLTDTLNDPLVKAGFGTVISAFLDIIRVGTGVVAKIGEIIGGLEVLTGRTGDRMEAINSAIETNQKNAERFSGGFWRAVFGDKLSDELLAKAKANIAALAAEQNRLLFPQAAGQNPAPDAVYDYIKGELDGQLGRLAADMPRIFAPAAGSVRRQIDALTYTLFTVDSGDDRSFAAIDKFVGSRVQMVLDSLRNNPRIQMLERNQAAGALTSVGEGAFAQNDQQIAAALGGVNDKWATMDVGYRDAIERMKGYTVDFTDFLGVQAQAQIAMDQAKNMSMGDAFSMTLGALAAGSRKWAQIQQKLALAETIWSTSAAIMKAMKLPWPANLAAAAKVAAMGAVEISRIKATSFNGGSSGGLSMPSASAGNVGSADTSAASTPSGIQQQEIRPQATVVIHGNIFSSQETANWFIDQIRDAVNNRDVTIIGTNSRQALDLAGAGA